MTPGNSIASAIHRPSSSRSSSMERITGKVYTNSCEVHAAPVLPNRGPIRPPLDSRAALPRCVAVLNFDFFLFLFPVSWLLIPSRPCCACHSGSQADQSGRDSTEKLQRKNCAVQADPVGAEGGLSRRSGDIILSRCDGLRPRINSAIRDAAASA